MRREFSFKNYLTCVARACHCILCGFVFIERATSNPRGFALTHPVERKRSQSVVNIARETRCKRRKTPTGVHSNGPSNRPSPVVIDYIQNRRNRRPPTCTTRRSPRFYRGLLMGNYAKCTFKLLKYIVSLESDISKMSAAGGRQSPALITTTATNWLDFRRRHVDTFKYLPLE